jgi:hypothetical protein
LRLAQADDRFAERLRHGGDGRATLGHGATTFVDYFVLLKVDGDCTSAPRSNSLLTNNREPYSAMVIALAAIVGFGG